MPPECMGMQQVISLLPLTLSLTALCWNSAVGSGVPVPVHLVPVSMGLHHLWQPVTHVSSCSNQPFYGLSLSALLVCAQLQLHGCTLVSVIGC